MTTAVQPRIGSNRFLLKKDTHEIGLILNRFQENTRCRSVLLIDEAGHLVSKHGEDTSPREATVIALLAGTFQTTRRLSRLLGAKEFSSRVDCGMRDLMMLQVGDDALLAITLGDESTSTLVRTYALESIRRLEKVFHGAAERSEESALEESGWKGNDTFARAVTDRLDALFG
ncbi:MAG: roadblock/LC7 domain-containing protein [Planctomycetes bacterium]|nr:roadblock/LC7 domain-containing protein [Planctomycetota bacterium]